MNQVKLVKSLLLVSMFIFGANAIAADQSVAERTKPVGSVLINDNPAATTNAAQTTVAATAEANTARTGEEIYNKFCFACHTSGVAGAPKHDDKADWAPRVAKGRDTLMNSLKNGIAGTSMMAKGTCMDCTDEELNSVLDYMLKNVQ